MNDKQNQELLKLGFLVMAGFFAPVWIPVSVIIVGPTLLFLGGLVSVIALGITSFLTVILAVFGMPILFSLTVTAGVYVVYKAFEKISAKACCLLKRSYSELNITGMAMTFDLKQFLKGLPIINRFVASQDNCECLCEQPLYEEESETETVVSHARRPSMHIPFPKASLPVLDASESGDEIEVFFNNMEELYTLISRLRKSARYRAASRRMRPRRNTMS